MHLYLRLAIYPVVFLAALVGTARAEDISSVIKPQSELVLDANSPGAVVLRSSPDASLDDVRRDFTQNDAEGASPLDCGETGCWVAYRITNGSGESQQFYPNPEAADVMDAWVIRGNGSVQQLRQSGAVGAQVSDRESRYPHFLLDAGEHVTLLARFKLGRMFREAAEPRIVLTPYQAFLEGGVQQNIFEGLLIGAFVALALYNISFAVAAKDRSYLWYCLYLFFSCITSFSAVEGLVTPLFAPRQPYVAVLVYAFASVGTWFSLVAFGREFLATKRHVPVIDRLWVISTLVFLSGPLLGMLNFTYWGQVAFLGISLPAPIGLVAAFVRLRQGYRPAKFFLIGQIGLCTGEILQVAQDFGLIDLHVAPVGWAHLFTSSSLWVGSFFDAVLFSLALADRVRTLTNTVAEQTIAHVNEREALMASQKEALVREVHERTLELQTEKAKSDQLLLTVLPAEIADELRAHGHSTPRRYDDASILFTDFRNFTITVSALPADRLVAELNDIFQHFDEILVKNGVEKIKTIGDSYMVAGGLPQAIADHAERCVAAALEMLDFMVERNRTSAIKWGMRAGIHSGSVVAGIVGKTKFAYDVFGDTVNIASRMESSSEPGRLNVSAYTYDLVRHTYHGEYRGKVDVKGKGEIDMYFISRIPQ